MTLAILFLKAYKSLVIGQNSIEFIEISRETLRRSSTIIINGSHKMLSHNSTYHPLNQDDKSAKSNDSDISNKSHELECIRSDLNRSIDELKSMLKPDFVKGSFSCERESLIRSDNVFILAEHSKS